MKRDNGMGLIRKPQLLALGVLVLCAWVLRAGKTASPRLIAQSASIPGTLGGLWEGKPIETDPRALEILETDDVTLMEYRLGSGEEPPVWFAQVTGFGNRAAFHPPELCYVGSHFEILEREPITVLANGRAHRLMRLVIAQDEEQFESWYWFTANDRVTHNYYQQQLWLVMDSIRREPMHGTLARISTPIKDPDATHRRLLAFLTAFTARPTASDRPQARHGV